MCNPQQLQNEQRETNQQQQQQQQEQEQDVSINSTPPSSPPSSPTAAYALYLHREELRRRKAHSARASMTKIHLTNELIAITKENITHCSHEDLEILARETIFKKNLQRHLHYRRQMLQVWMSAKKQGKIGRKAN